MTREKFVKTLEELVKINSYIARNFAEENEAKMLLRENAVYRELIQKTEDGMFDERLLRLMLDVSDFDQFDLDEERYQREPRYDRRGLPFNRRAEVRGEIFDLYDEEGWGETDEVYLHETERRQLA